MMEIKKFSEIEVQVECNKVPLYIARKISDMNRPAKSDTTIREEQFITRKLLIFIFTNICTELKDICYIYFYKYAHISCFKFIMTN